MVLPSDSYKLLAFVKSDFNYQVLTSDLEPGVSPAKEMCQCIYLLTFWRQIFSREN